MKGSGTMAEGTFPAGPFDEGVQSAEGPVRTASATDRKFGPKGHGNPADAFDSMPDIRAILDGIGEGIFTADSAGTILMLNREIETMWGLPAHAFLGRPLGKFLVGDNGFRIPVDPVEFGRTTWGLLGRRIALHGMKHDGEPIPVTVRLTRVTIGGRQLLAALVQKPEVAEHPVYSLAVQAANDGLWEWDLTTNLIQFSPRWKAMIGYGETELENKPDEWFSRVHPNDIFTVRSAVDAVTKGTQLTFEEEYRMLHRDGTYRWVLNRGLGVLGSDGSPHRMAGSVSDVSKRRMHDTLTGLPNRALFLDRVERLLARTHRNPEYALAVLFIDLDRFKFINDSLGHPVGDLLLVEAARRLEACLRPGDAVTRFGGDEFAVLLDDVKDAVGALRIVQRIQQEIARPFELGKHEVQTSASIGVAISTTGYTGAHEMLRDADTAMYRAKADGGARHEIFDLEMRSWAVAKLNLEVDLRKAVDRGQLAADYQTIVDLESGKDIGLECLLRWKHPSGKVILPGEFLPIAEETGLITPISFWMLDHACRQMREWQLKFKLPPSFTISVKLSGKRIAKIDLVARIDRILRDTQLDPRSLRLEISESVTTGDTVAVTAILLQLKDRGIQLVIDDFGTGYSSLSYLHRFNFNALKVDRTFVKRLGIDEESSEVIKTICVLATSLCMDVVAEGVETAEQLRRLKCLGCRYGQGYLFSQPMDAKHVAQYFESKQKALQG
ncbi:MAG: EAL domain-containing protein [Nitrospirae bacterium]|nr:EAL domain-containing protein [Nitrospirota bacterium]